MRQKLNIQESELQRAQVQASSLPAATGDSLLLSIQVKCEYNVNTSMATTPAHLLPATTAVTAAELNSSSVEQFKDSKRCLAWGKLLLAGFIILRKLLVSAVLVVQQSKAGYPGILQWNTQEAGSERGKAATAAMFVMIQLYLPFAPGSTQRKKAVI